MIAVSDKDFVIYLQHIGYKIIDYKFVGTFNGDKKYAYIFNDRKRISQLKEMYELGELNI